MTGVAEVRLPTEDLHQDLPFYENLGFRLDLIFPADDPSVAVISGHGLRLRLVRGAEEAPGTIRIMTDDKTLAGGVRALTAPSGVRVEIAPPGEDLPPVAVCLRSAPADGPKRPTPAIAARHSATSV